MALKEELEEELQEEISPCYTYWEKGHPIPKFDFDAMLTEATYHDNPEETRKKYTEIGALEISSLLRECDVPDDVGKTIMSGIGFFYAVPTFLGHVSKTLNLVGKASDDVRAGKLHKDELVLRVLLRLRCDRTDHKISEEEKKWMRVMAGGNVGDGVKGYGVSSIARICERSKASVSDIVNNVSHAYSERAE